MSTVVVDTFLKGEGKCAPIGTFSVDDGFCVEMSPGRLTLLNQDWAVAVLLLWYFNSEGVNMKAKDGFPLWNEMGETGSLENHMPDVDTLVYSLTEFWNSCFPAEHTFHIKQKPQWWHLENSIFSFPHRIKTECSYLTLNESIALAKLNFIWDVFAMLRGMSSR